MAGSTVTPAARSWPIAQGMFVDAFLKFGFTRTCTPPPGFAVAEYQKGETSTKRSAFCTTEVMPWGWDWVVIQ